MGTNQTVLNGRKKPTESTRVDPYDMTHRHPLAISAAFSSLRSSRQSGRQVIDLHEASRYIVLAMSKLKTIASKRPCSADGSHQDLIGERESRHVSIHAEEI